MNSSRTTAERRRSAYAAGYAAIAGALTCIIAATFALTTEPVLALLSQALPL